MARPGMAGGIVFGLTGPLPLAPPPELGMGGRVNCGFGGMGDPGGRATFGLLVAWAMDKTAASSAFGAEGNTDRSRDADERGAGASCWGIWPDAGSEAARMQKMKSGNRGTNARGGWEEE